MPTVTTVLRKDKCDKQGESPIYFRIIKNRKSSYIASSIKIPEAHWDEKKNKIKSCHKNSSRLNSFLSNKFTEIQDTVFEFETISKSTTSRSLREKVFGKIPVNFFAFADDVVSQYRADGKIGTYSKNKSIITKLKKYHPKELTFNDITLEFLMKYEQYLKSKLLNKTNTVNKDMKFIRKVFNDAIRQDVIEYQISPFMKYQSKSEKTERFHLPEKQLEWIERFPATPGSKIELHKDMFLFSACTGGLRISDILQLQWRNFDGTHLNLVIRKTGAQLCIKVPDKGLEIINKHKPPAPRNDMFIFQMLPKTIDLKDPEMVDAAISSATAYVNKNLKIIAQAVGIEKSLSFHISRHSFAVRALRKGISIDKVSKLMAHSAIRETQIYAKIVDEDLDKAMDIFNI